MSNLSLSEITFPVFRLGEVEPIVENGATFYLSLSEDGDERTYHLRLIDDKKIKGKSLATRRIALITNGRKVQRISRAFFFIGDFLKASKSTTWFIDYKGILFNYKKSKYVPLTYKKIDKTIRLPSGGAIIEVAGTRYKVLFAPKVDELYVGLLIIGTGQSLLYGVYKEKHKDSRRMI